MLALLIQVLYKGYVAFNAANSIRCQSGEGAQIKQGVLDCHHAHSCLGVTEDVKLAPLQVDNRAPADELFQCSCNPKVSERTKEAARWRHARPKVVVKSQVEIAD